jgi:pimeloyl-ACP methyl ester carboxylesterase
VESLVHVLDALGIKKTHVLAHSMGTIIAQHLTANHPDRVDSLALFGPLLAPPEAAREPTLKRAQLARTGATGMQEIADAIAKGATSNQTKDERPAVTALVRESIMRQPAEGYALNCEALANAHAANIKNISVPVLLVTGDEDTVGAPQSVKKIADQLAKSELHVLDGCGHWTVYEKPLECVRIISEFYKH